MALLEECISASPQQRIKSRHEQDKLKEHTKDLPHITQ